MSNSPIVLPEIPPYYQLPEALDSAFTQAMDQRAAVSTALAAVGAISDPGFDVFLRQTYLEVALAAAKIASSYAVCQIQDWLDEVEP